VREFPKGKRPWRINQNDPLILHLLTAFVCTKNDRFETSNEEKRLYAALQAHDTLKRLPLTRNGRVRHEFFIRP